MEVIVYTDGACSKNGHKDARAGYGVYFPNKELHDISKRFRYPPYTNQRAELYAILVAIRRIVKRLDFNKIIIYTDSMYSINCITKWIKKWKKNKWKTSDDRDVKNKDIIQKIDKYSKYNIVYIHVKGHDGIEGNEMADKFAVLGKDKKLITKVTTKLIE